MPFSGRGLDHQENWHACEYSVIYLQGGWWSGHTDLSPSPSYPPPSLDPRHPGHHVQSALSLRHSQAHADSSHTPLRCTLRSFLGLLNLKHVTATPHLSISPFSGNLTSPQTRDQWKVPNSSVSPEVNWPRVPPRGIFAVTLPSTDNTPPL